MILGKNACKLLVISSNGCTVKFVIKLLAKQCLVINSQLNLLQKELRQYYKKRNFDILPTKEKLNTWELFN